MWLWPALVFAPSLFLTQMSLNYALVEWACSSQKHGALQIVPAVSLVIILATVAIAAGGWRRGPPPPRKDGGGPPARRGLLAPPGGGGVAAFPPPARARGGSPFSVQTL